MEDAYRKGRNFFGFRHRRADGSVRDVEVHSGPILLKGRELLYFTIIDVTEELRNRLRKPGGSRDPR